MVSDNKTCQKTKKSEMSGEKIKSEIYKSNFVGM